MAAATVTLSTAVGDQANVFPRQVYGLNVFDVTTELATTQLDDANDDTNLLQFPQNSRLWDVWVDLDDLDTGGTPALVWDLVVEATDGTGTVVLINDSTVGQTAGTDTLDTRQTSLLIDVSLKYLQFRIVTKAATAAAGTLRVRGAFFTGFGGQLTGT